MKNLKTLSTFPNLISNRLGLKILSDESYIYSIQIYTGKEKKSTSLAENAIKQIQEYLKSRRTKFDLPVKVEGTDFQKKVWSNLSNIKYGRTISYQKLAINIGHEKAFRAVGGACGKNPLLIVIPCHRVITKNGDLGGFVGGPALKTRLLSLEGVIGT